MWLLNARTLKLELFYGESIPPYAILSHRWRADEVLYQDLVDRGDDPDVQARAGYVKIRKTCELAIEDGLDYAWIDTCCIDKRSSAELSEAINSMFRWYWRAEKCYAYLDDVGRLPRLSGPVSELDGMSLELDLEECGFMQSSWFTRGWTLQELTAPSDVAITEITGIDSMVLEHRSEIKNMSVATRMSWAALRQTTRIEDQAYSLLGIFGVNMPMLYGEGSRAFTRLQEEVIKSSTDQSLLTWSGGIETLPAEETPEPTAAGILATSPGDFVNCRRITYRGDIAVHQSYDITNAGLRMKLPMLKNGEVSWGILNCKQDGNLLGVQLQAVSVPRLHKALKLRTIDTKAYSILTIRNNSHIKFMRLVELEGAVWEDIVIVSRTPTFGTAAVPHPLIGLRFVNCGTHQPLTDFIIISMMPSGLWDLSNMVQPTHDEDAVVVPFSPATEVAMGAVILHSRGTRQRLAVYFRYDARTQDDGFISHFVGMSNLEANSEGVSTNWEEFCHRNLLTDDVEQSIVQTSFGTGLKPIVKRVGRFKLAAVLVHQYNAEGNMELELRLTQTFEPFAQFKPTRQFGTIAQIKKTFGERRSARKN